MSDLDRADEDLRTQAIGALKKRRDFRAHLLIYVMVNSALVTIWMTTNHGTFFWPVFVLVFWGIGLVMNAWDVYVAQDFSEEKIQRQMHRLAGRH